MEIFVSVVTGLLSAGCLAFLGFLYRYVKDFVNDFLILKETERNDLKAHIVSVYERSQARGYITHMELESVNRMGDSYEKLDGNSYISSILHIMNNHMIIKGQSISSIYAIAANQDKDVKLREHAEKHLAETGQ